MNISAPFIDRPVATTLLMIAVAFAGMVAFPLLPVAPLPKVDFPTINVSASLPGASPETMASAVAQPLERQFSQIAGVTQMTSTSTLGATSIALQFDLNRDIDAAAQDVQSAIAAAGRQLPTDMPSPPTYRKVNPADSPVLVMGVHSDTLPLTVVDDYADTILAQQMSQIDGVSQVSIGGEQKPAVRVQVDPAKLATKNLTLEDIRSVIAAATTNAAKGTLYSNDRSLTLAANDQLSKASDYADVIVAYRNGAAVRIKDVGEAIEGPENLYTGAWDNSKRAVLLVVFKQPGANVIETVDKVKAALPRLRAVIPQAISVDILSDRTETIRASVDDVEFTLGLTICLVVLVILLFLRNLRVTLIPGLVVPLSLLGALAVMNLCGFSLDNISLMALTISVGFVVDDAIVVVENIYRHIEDGMPASEAALKGSREIGFTIVSITFSLIAVFIPVLLMGGMVGRVFREFAVSVSVAIIVSGFVSLTLTPMLCARVLKAHRPGEEEKQNFVLRAFERGFAAMLRGYEVTLDIVLRFKSVMLVVTFATIAGTIWLYIVVPKGFFPTEDTGYLLGITEGKTDIAFAAMVEHQRKVAEIVRRDPAVDYVNSTVGAGGPNNLGNNGRMLVALKPRKERGNLSEIVQRLRRDANVVPGLQIFFQPIQNINLGGRLNKSQYQYTLQSNETDTLYRVAPEMRDKVAKLPGLLDVTTDLYVKNPQITVEIDRERAAVYGVSIDQVRQELYNAFGSRQVATIYTPANDYQVILEVMPEFQQNPESLRFIYLKTENGTTVPLSAVAHFERTVGPLQINHQGQQPSVTISFNLAPGYSLGQAVEAIQNLEREERLPGSIATGFQGTAQVFQDSLRGQGVLILAAIFAAYVVLGILYESFIHPITIISGLPSAGIGAILTLMLFGMDLSVIAMIGIVMLVGIVKKNAIMMIDFAIDRRRVGLSAEAAIREAATLRFRPIMMTTFAAIFGTLPIALGTGAGAELRQPLGVAVVGGLCLSQLLTLYITPVIYLYLDRVDRMIKRRIEPQVEEVKELPPAVAAE
jgi:HAE1 family hydrophobic/amphiphilic exporter-1